MAPALVHDYLLVMRGAERTFDSLAACWPDAPVYTLLYDAEGTHGRFEGHAVQSSNLQRLNARQHSFRRLLPLFPIAARSLDLREHKLVVSSSSAFAHGVRTDPDAVHVCYCHTPFRYAWYERERALGEMRRPFRPALNVTLDAMRRWDLKASRRVTHYVANGEITRERIAQFYDRDSVVIHPPVDVHRFAPGEPEDYFLVVCELVRHKRVDLALEAARRAGRRIKVVGSGPAMPELEEEYGDSAEFLGRVGDDQMAELYAGALAAVMPNVEEFGIAAVEAQASGRPVLAADAGGARETVIQGVTGVRVTPGDADALAEVMHYVDFTSFSPDKIRANAERFSTETFQARMRELVAGAVAGP